MGWTGIARREHSREGLRYPSDMTEREWRLCQTNQHLVRCTYFELQSAFNQAFLKET
jgi:hypothetical protein